MSEHLLDDRKGNALFEQVCGKAVTQGVNADLTVHICFNKGVFKDFCGCAYRDWDTSEGSFKKPGVRAVILVISPECFE